MGGLVICAVLALAVFAAPVLAQDWPARKAVTMVVPFAAGGPVDTIGRILASGLSETLGQHVIVENVGGAGGMTGASRVAKAAPDGYVFLLGGSAIAQRFRQTSMCKCIGGFLSNSVLPKTSLIPPDGYGDGGPW